MVRRGNTPTRKDVAKLAGVSETVVSYVLNNNRYVAKEKRERVLDAVERFGYTDQSHLLREFKRFHGIPLTQARRIALGDVAFLQDLPPNL